MPLVDVPGNVGAFAYRQRVAIFVNVGTTLLPIVADLLPDALQPELLVTVIPRVTEPVAAAVYLMLLVPPPEVIVPLLIVHE